MINELREYIHSLLSDVHLDLNYRAIATSVFYLAEVIREGNNIKRVHYEDEYLRSRGDL